jgi:hypothetical protein
MDAHANAEEPGIGLPVTGDGIDELVEIPCLDDATAALVASNLLCGGMPGSGKSVRPTLAAIRAARSIDNGRAVVFTPQKGGHGNADPGR